MIAISDRKINRNFRYAGKNDYQETLLNNFRLSERVQVNNFCKILKGAIDFLSIYPYDQGISLSSILNIGYGA